jgi:hypothetical protein
VGSIGARNRVAVEVESTPDVEDSIFGSIGNSLQLGFKAHLNLSVPACLGSIHSVDIGGVLRKLTSRDLVDFAFLSVIVGVSEGDDDGLAGVRRSTVDSADNRVGGGNLSEGVGRDVVVPEVVELHSELAGIQIAREDVHLVVEEFCLAQISSRGTAGGEIGNELSPSVGDEIVAPEVVEGSEGGFVESTEQVKNVSLDDHGRSNSKSWTSIQWHSLNPGAKGRSVLPEVLEEMDVAEVGLVTDSSIDDQRVGLVVSGDGMKGSCGRSLQGMNEMPPGRRNIIVESVVEEYVVTVSHIEALEETSKENKSSIDGGHRGTASERRNVAGLRLHFV